MRNKTLLCLLIATYIVHLVSFTTIVPSHKGGKHFGTPVKEILYNYKNKKIQRRLKGYAKPDKPNKYIEYFNSIKTREDGRDYANNYKRIALKAAFQKNALLKSKTEDLAWEQRGPANVGGRTRAIVIDPEDLTNSTWFAGSVAGGVWKTTNKGQIWNIISPDLPNLSISSIAIAKKNTQIIYIGTGEGHFNVDAIRGDGIFKSNDKGATWEQLSSTSDNETFNYVNSIVIDNVDANIVFAATNTGILKTVDGGITWIKQSIIEGRYQKLIQHPRDNQVYWAACNNVGIFKTDNAGANWYLAESFPDGVNRIELAISDSDPDFLYALTEDSKLYFSVDGGLEWGNTVQESPTIFLSGQGWYNNVIVSHPEDNNKGFIGGVDLFSFTLGAEESNVKRAYTIQNTTSSFLDYDNCGGSFLNGGIEIMDEYGNLSSEIELQFGPGKTQKAHVLVNKNGSVEFSRDINKDLSLLKYDNKYIDVPFKAVNKSTNQQLAISFIDANENGGFELYDNAYELILIHNINYTDSPNTSIINNNGNDKLLCAILPKSSTWDESGIVLSSLQIIPFELKDRALVSSKISDWSKSVSDSKYSHADHHQITIMKKGTNEFSVLVGNDGGLSLSEDGGVNWETRINGYITSQFYGVDRHPTEYKYFGGMQDNGSYLSNENPNKESHWKETLSGDGFDVVWHAREPNQIIGSYYYNQLTKSVDGGDNFQALDDLIDDSKSEDLAPFITVIANSDVDPDLLLLGGKSGVSRSTDFGKTWNITDMGEDWNFVPQSYPKIGISEANPDVVWAGIRLAYNSSLHVSTDGGVSFVALPNPVNEYTISNIVTHPTDPNIAYLLFSHADLPKILRTSDLGQTWEDITGFGLNGSKNSSNGFPNVATLSMLVKPNNTSELLAGTEIGLFISRDNGISWQYADNGLPAVCIWKMKSIGDEIILATHGLGVWTVKLENLHNKLIHPYIKDVVASPQKEIAISSVTEVAFDSLQIYLDNDLVHTVEYTESGNRIDLIEPEPEVNILVKLIGYIDGVPFWSNTKKTDIVTVLDPVNSYVNNFSARFDDFEGQGMSVTRGDLDNNSIQTSHPYPENTQLIYQLKYPIIVSDNHSHAFIKYDDIAFIEEGEVGAKFQDPEFYDYVTIEASKDGITWTPLTAGYDFNYDQDWASSGKSYESIPNHGDYSHHYIDLHEFFNPKDVILIRFRLLSDEYTTGWGWSIDNLQIQDDNFSETEKDDLEFEITLYPNPSNGSFNVKIDDPFMGELEIRVSDLSGRVFYNTRVDKNLGNYKVRQSVDFPNTGIFIVTLSMDDREISKKLLVQ